MEWENKRLANEAHQVRATLRRPAATHAQPADDMPQRCAIPRRVETPAPTQEAPVDVNAARMETLASLPGIGVAQAHRIVQRRMVQPFTSLEELGDFLNLKPHHMQRLRGRLAFTTPQAEVSAPPPPRSEETPRGRRGRVID